jgi:hypothetical protein
MRTATSLTILAIGAIFAFAITASPTFLNLQISGWILMLTGVAGLLLSRRSQNWLRRTVVVRSPASTPGTPRAARRPVRQLPPPAGRPRARRAPTRRAPAGAAPAGAAPAATAPAGAAPAGASLAGTAADPAVIPDDTVVDQTQPIERETIDEYIEQ